MTATSRSKQVRENVREHRQRLRAQGLRPIQIWVPDVRAPPSRSRRIVRRRRSPPAPMPARIKLSSTPCPTGAANEGEVWTVSGGKGYTGRLRPAVIVQDDSFDATNSVTICAFTTDPTEAPLIRLVEPNQRNGLRSACRLMLDKITTVPRTKIGALVGRLDDEDMMRLNQTMTVFLGIAASRPVGRRKAP